MISRISPIITAFYILSAAVRSQPFALKNLARCATFSIYVVPSNYNVAECLMSFRMNYTWQLRTIKYKTHTPYAIWKKSWWLGLHIWFPSILHFQSVSVSAPFLWRILHTLLPCSLYLFPSLSQSFLGVSCHFRLHQKHIILNPLLMH